MSFCGQLGNLGPIFMHQYENRTQTGPQKPYLWAQKQPKILFFIKNAQKCSQTYKNHI